MCMRNLCLNDNDDTTTSKQIYVCFMPAMVPHRTSLAALRSGELESDCREVIPSYTPRTDIILPLEYLDRFWIGKSSP